MIDYWIGNWIDCWIELGEGRKGGGCLRGVGFSVSWLVAGVFSVF